MVISENMEVTKQHEETLRALAVGIKKALPVRETLHNFIGEGAYYLSKLSTVEIRFGCWSLGKSWSLQLGCWLGCY